MYVGARLQFTRALGNLADLNVGVSEFVGRDIRRLGIDPRKVACVHNGTPPERFHPGVDGARLRREYGVREEDVLALQLARIWQPKRQEDFVRALAIARTQQPQLRGLIVGWDDPRYTGSFSSYRAEIEQLARELGLGDALIIGKARPEAPELHAAADIFVLPSIHEPFGLVVVEAMASERPVVAARSGGIPEIIEDGRSGFLVPVRSPDEIAERLVRLAASPALRAKIGREARKRVLDCFTEAHVAAQFARVYEALARGADVSLDAPKLAGAAL
jgi:glycosyltransferase involved in cell wall biosynthesis